MKLEEMRSKLFKLKNPVTVNGEPVLKNNLWNFRVGFDGLMHNTMYSNFVLSYNENDFEVVFDFDEFEERKYTEAYETYDKNDVFVDGVDVQVHGVVTKMTYCFVRKSAEPEKLRALKYAYDDMKYRKAQYEAATTKYEKLLAATDTSKLPTDVEEFLRNVKL